MNTNNEVQETQDIIDQRRKKWTNIKNTFSEMKKSWANDTTCSVFYIDFYYGLHVKTKIFDQETNMFLEEVE